MRETARTIWQLANEKARFNIYITQWETGVTNETMETGETTFKRKHQNSIPDCFEAAFFEGPCQQYTDTQCTFPCYSNIQALVSILLLQMYTTIQKFGVTQTISCFPWLTLLFIKWVAKWIENIVKTLTRLEIMKLCFRQIILHLQQLQPCRPLAF